MIADKQRTKQHYQKALQRTQQKLINERDRAVCAEIERDELAAHVERLREALNDQLTDCINFDDGQLTTYIQANSAQVLKQTPTTSKHGRVYATRLTSCASLARHDLIKQAEALEAEAQNWPSCEYVECTHVRQYILESACDLRQQAKELNQ